MKLAVARAVRRRKGADLDPPVVELAVDCHESDDLGLDALALRKLSELEAGRCDEDVHCLLFDDPGLGLALRAKLHFHPVIALLHPMVVGLAKLLNEHLHRPRDDCLDAEALHFFRRVGSLRQVVPRLAPLVARGVCVWRLVAAMHAPEASRFHGSRNVPGFVVALCRPVPDDARAVVAR